MANPLDGEKEPKSKRKSVTIPDDPDKSSSEEEIESIAPELTAIVVLC